MYSKVLILGNCGGKPEMRYSPAGKAVCSFSVATNHSYKDKNGGWQSKPTWYKITAWNDLAERCNEKVHKGDTVFIEGRINPGEGGSPKVWTAKDGTPMASYEVNAQTVKYLSGRSEPTSNVDTNDDSFIDF